MKSQFSSFRIDVNRLLCFLLNSDVELKFRISFCDCPVSSRAPNVSKIIKIENHGGMGQNFKSWGGIDANFKLIKDLVPNFFSKYSKIRNHEVFTVSFWLLWSVTVRLTV